MDDRLTHVFGRKGEPGGEPTLENGRERGEPLARGRYQERGQLGSTFAYQIIVQATGAEALMAKACQECGAPLPEGGKCIDHFHALLLLEYEVAADPAIAASERGLIAHFYAVSSYVLQHPEGMNYTAQALAEARRGLGEHLAGKVTLSEQRHRVRRIAERATRVTRRAGDQVVQWPVDSWNLTVVDVLTGGAEGYCEHVTAWAESILRALDTAGV